MPDDYDIEHAAFVRQEYRRTIRYATAVKSRSDAAREVAMDTNLDSASAQRIADAILAENNQPRAFEVVFEGTMGGDPTSGGPPSYVLTCARYELINYPAKATGFTEDYEANTTTVQVRG